MANPLTQPPSQPTGLTQATRPPTTSTWRPSMGAGASRFTTTASPTAHRHGLRHPPPQPGPAAPEAQGRRPRRLLPLLPRSRHAELGRRRAQRAVVLRRLRAAGRSRNVGTARVRTAFHGTECMQPAWVCGSAPRRAGGAGGVGGELDGAGVDCGDEVRGR